MTEQTPLPTEAIQAAAINAAKASGVIIDDHHIASDLHCWECQYNLRTLAIDGACPECGTTIYSTLEHNDGRETRPFSLYTINPVSRFLGFSLGVLGPGLIVSLAALAPMDPILSDWQSGRIEDYAGVMLAGRSMWAFYPFLIWSYIALSCVIFAPLQMGRRWWVRAGLWLGCALGVQYQLIIGLNLMGLSDELLAAILIGLVPIGGLAVVVFSFARGDKTRKPKQTSKLAKKKATTIATVVIVLLVLGSIVTGGVVLLIPLFAGPYCMLLCMGAALCRVYRTDFAPPAQRTPVAAAAATVGGYLTAWPLAIGQAQIVYNSLPMQPQGCYICTASAHGHRWLTGARATRLTDGSTMLVSRQMKILKAGEWLIEDTLPGTHSRLRRVYDWIGPCIASRIRSRFAADFSFLLFVPAALIAWLLLSALGRACDIERAYQDIR